MAATKSYLVTYLGREAESSGKSRRRDGAEKVPMIYQVTCANLPKKQGRCAKFELNLSIEIYRSLKKKFKKKSI